MYYGIGYGFWPFMLAFYVLWIVFFIRIIVWLARFAFGWGGRGRWRMGGSALDTLNERYAKGEINKEEYEQKRKTFLPRSGAAVFFGLYFSS